MSRRFGLLIALLALAAHMLGGSVHGVGMARAAADAPAGMASEAAGGSGSLVADLLLLCSPAGHEGGEGGAPATQNGCVFCLHAAQGVCDSQMPPPDGGFLGLAMHAAPLPGTQLWEVVLPRVTHPRAPPVPTV